MMKSIKLLSLATVVGLSLLSCKKGIQPTISLNGEHNVETELNQEYEDPGAIAEDARGNDLTSDISVTNNVDIEKVGDYNILYDVSDEDGNRSSTVKRMVKVRNGADHLSGFYTISSTQSSGTSTSEVVDEIGISKTVNNKFYVKQPYAFYAVLGEGGQINIPLQGDINNSGQKQGSGQVQSDGNIQFHLDVQKGFYYYSADIQMEKY